MKLSNIKGERTLDVIAEVIEPIANIAEDEEAAKLFRRQKLPKGMDRKTFLIRRMKKSVPRLLRNHKEDVIGILSAIEGVSQEEYADGLSLVKLIKDCIDLITDSVFVELFISAQTETSSGSAQENTGDQKA